MIQFYGDSITAGVPGVSFCKYLKSHEAYQNYGVGGDTVTGLINRIHDIKLNVNDYYILEIGTNDILLAYLKKKSSSWRKTINGIEKSGRIITKNREEFAGKYNELLNKFKDYKTIIVSIPCIGEEIESKVNEKVDSYNNIIKELCYCTGKAYIDFNTWQKKEIKARVTKQKAFISDHASGMIVDIILTKYLGLTNILSKKRNLCTTVDGVHLNSYGALTLASMIEKELKKIRLTIAST